MSALFAYVPQKMLGLDGFNLCMLDNFALFFCHLQISLFINFLKKLRKPSECQTVGSRWGLIWVQTACIGLQQIAKVITSKKRLKITFLKWTIGTLLVHKYTGGSRISGKGVQIYKEGFDL